MGLWNFVPLAAVLTVHVISFPQPLDISPLPHGLLKTEHDVREIQGVWTLIITFPRAPLLSPDVAQSIRNARDHLLQWKVPAKFRPRRDFWAHHLTDLLLPTDNLVFPPRRRRALVPIVGTIGKTLFGFSTTKDYDMLRDAVRRNKEYTAAMHHDQEKLLSVINITRMQWLEDRHLLDAVARQSRSLSSHVTALRTEMTDFRWLSALADVHGQVFHLASKVAQLHRRRTRYLNARHDLEKGTLSELLLPLQDFRLMVDTEQLPQGAHFVTPLLWYYRQTAVRTLSGTGDLTYVVRLPLVSGRRIKAVQVKSFPVPNVKSNVTLQFEVSEYVYYDPSTGLTQSLQMSSCMGRNPIVCYRSPEVRSDHHTHKCLHALYSNLPIRDLCKVRVSQRASRRDIFYMHDVNDYILVTWGTRLRDQCDRSGTRSLSPGVYRVQWSGNCSLCSSEVCVQGIFKVNSAFNFEEWQPLVVDPFLLPNSVGNLSVPGLATLPPLAEPRLIDLKGLLTATEPPLPSRWDDHQQSIFADSLLGSTMGIMFVSIAIILFCYRKWVKVRLTRCLNQTNGAIGLGLSDNRQAKDTVSTAPQIVLPEPLAHSTPISASVLSLSEPSASRDDAFQTAPSKDYRFETESLADGRIAIVPILSQTAPVVQSSKGGKGKE